MTATSSSSLWRNRDFVRFLAGQFVTNAGDSLYTVAVLWLVFELTGSSSLVGLVNAILLLPWLLQALAGPIVDRLPTRAVLVGSQLVQGVVVLVLPLAAATGRLGVDVILAVVPVLMLATLLMSPMQATVVPRLLPEGQLSRGNSALATVTLGLDMVFDALGGAFIALIGTTALFLVDAGTFALAAVLFAGIALSPTNVDDGDGPDSGVGVVLREYAADLRAGFGVLRGTVFVELAALTALANFATGVALAVLPAFGAGLGGPVAYGFMLGALGIGRLVGSLLAPRVEDIPYGWFTLVGFTLAGCSWLAAVYAPAPAATIVLFGLAWVPAGAAGVLTATLNQRVFPTDLLGRVTSAKGTLSGATLPLGSLVGGFVGQSLGPSTTMALAAGGFGLQGLWTLARPRLRRLPAVADAEPDDFDVGVPAREE